MTMKRSRGKGAWRWLVACVAAGLVLAVTLALSLGAPARAEGDDAGDATVGQASGQAAEAGADDEQNAAEDVSGDVADADGEPASGDEGAAAAKPSLAPAAGPAEDATDDWHDESGLPNYGLRIVLDDDTPGSWGSVIGMDFRVRATNGTADDNVVLEKYRWDSGTGKYVLLATSHLTADSNNWGGEYGNELDNKYLWMWSNGVNYWQSWNGWTGNTFVVDLDQRNYNWQRLGMFVRTYGTDSYGVTLASDGQSATSTTNAYYWTTMGDTTHGDVYVLRAADTSDGSLVAGPSSSAYQYQIEGTRYGDREISWGVSSATGDPQAISSWTSIGEGAYGDFTGVRTLPAQGEGVETLDLTARQRNSSEYEQTTGSDSSSFTMSDRSNYVVIRNDGSYSGQMPVTVTVSASEDTYNDRPGWGDPNYQFSFNAICFSYDSGQGRYSYNSWIVGEYGVHLGGVNSFTYNLAPGQAIVIQPGITKYAYSYKVTVGNGYVIDWVSGADGSDSYDDTTFTSGTIASFAPKENSVSGQEIVLHTSTVATPASSDFTRLTSENVGEGKQMRSLKVNLFDYDIPDDWKYTSGDQNTQGDVQYRFTSYGSTYSGSGYYGHGSESSLNYVHRGTHPYVGILKSQLDAATGLPVFNYTTPFQTGGLGGLFSTTDGDYVTEDVGTAYKWTMGTNETTQTNSRSYTSNRELSTLAEADAPVTWWNGQNASEGTTFTNTRVKRTYANVDFQFIYNENTGYYSYNSKRNHAQYDGTDKTIYQYDHTLGLGGSTNDRRYGYSDSEYANAVYDSEGNKAAGFFPFDTYEYGNGSYGTNYYGKSYAFQPRMSNDGTTLLRKEEDLDYHFGLSMTQEFAVPQGGTVTTKSGDTEDMVFSFSGDDDFWCFVDGQLVLDIGGIHDASSGSINFTKGTYTVDGTTRSLDTIFDGFSSSYPTVEDPDGSGDWAANTTHTFSIFYLERGGTYSNLGIRFNLPVADYSVQKVWDDDGNSGETRTEDAQFYLESTEDATLAGGWTKVDGSERTIAHDATNLSVSWANLDMFRYDADGSTTHRVYYRVVEVTPANSYSSVMRVWDASANDGAGAWLAPGDAGYATALATASRFQATNTYEPTTVSVTKVWDDEGADGRRPESVTVDVYGEDAEKPVATLTLDSSQTDDDGNWTATTGQLPKLDAEGNAITYTVSEEQVTGYTTSVSANQATDGSFAYTITNSRHITPVSIDPPVTKVVTGDTPEAYPSFSFVLTGEDGAPMPADAEGQSVTRTLSGTALSADKRATVELGEITYTAAGTYTYTVSEAAGTDTGWAYDDSAYTLTVVVSEADDGTLSAERTLTKNGAPAAEIAFTNTYTAPKTPGTTKTTTTTTVTKTVLPNTGDPSSVAGIVAGLLGGSGALAAAVATRRRSRR